MFGPGGRKFQRQTDESLCRPAAIGQWHDGGCRGDNALFAIPPYGIGV